MNALVQDNATARNDAQALVSQHAAMVRRIALHTADRVDHFIEVDDLIQVGFLGLLDATRRYDATTGVPFEAFALLRIRGAMMDELRRNDWCPRSVRQQGKSIAQARLALEQQHGRTITAKEIADYLNIDPESIIRTEINLKSAGRVSLEAMVDEYGDSFEELGASDESPVAPLLQAANTTELAHALSLLSEREQMILHLNYEKEMNLKEIALTLELTEARICQLRKQALTSLNKTLRSFF